MNPIDLQDIRSYVNDHIVTFHESRLRRLTELDLDEVLRKKNPYLFKAKHITIAGDFIKGVLDAFLSSAEEKLFGDFLEGLAIFVVTKTAGGHKSAAKGIDLEFEDEGIHYLVSVKSGPNWGNSAQQDKQEENFKKAVQVMKQSHHAQHVEAVLGICYGRTRTSDLRNYRKIVGQNFWYFISKNRDLYTDIVEPLGFRAKEHDEAFQAEKGKIVNLFTQEFMTKYCIDGEIDWQRVVKFNSGNLAAEDMVDQ